MTIELEKRKMYEIALTLLSSCGFYVDNFPKLEEAEYYKSGDFVSLSFSNGHFEYSLLKPEYKNHFCLLVWNSEYRSYRINRHFCFYEVRNMGIDL